MSLSQITQITQIFLFLMISWRFFEALLKTSFQDASLKYQPLSLWARTKQSYHEDWYQKKRKSV